MTGPFEFELPQDVILHNSFMTPDGTILVSRHVHDFKTHLDTVCNGSYFIDGGRQYIRRGWDTHCPPPIDLSAHVSDEHEVIRRRVEWGTYGPSGDKPLRYVKLYDMDRDHIQAILRTVASLSPAFFKVLMDELDYRNTPGYAEAEKYAFRKV
jgi:hypothetical protein